MHSIIVAIVFLGVGFGLGRVKNSAKLAVVRAAASKIIAAIRIRAKL